MPRPNSGRFRCLVRRYGFTVVLCVVTASLAQQAGVSSRAARQAMAKYQAATQRAQARWQKEVLVANEQCARDLELARSAAKRNGNEGDVAAISALLDQVHADAADVQNAAKPDDVTFGRYRKFVITAEGDWQETVPVRMGDRVHIEARGHWVGDTSRPQVTTCGPGGVVINNRNRFKLIGGRCGESGCAERHQHGNARSILPVVTRVEWMGNCFARRPHAPADRR